MPFHHAEGERPGGDCKQAEVNAEAAWLFKYLSVSIEGDGMGWVRCDLFRHPLFYYSPLDFISFATK